MFNKDIGIDLGTATVLVYEKNKGIVLNEPSVVAVNTQTNTVCAIGAEAYNMLGRTPPHIQVVHPLNDGVISNYTLTEAMIKGFLLRIFKHTLGKPRIMMCVPTGVTDVEQRAVIETAREMGAKDIYIIEEPVAAALGAGREIYKPHGTMVIDIGGGTTDIAVISLGSIVISRSLKIAGTEFNEAVIRYMKKERNLVIGPRTAERIKIKIGSVIPRDMEVVAEGKGISTISGLPRRFTLSSADLYPVFKELAFNMTERIKEVLEETPPELHGDILQDGILLTGGGALLYGLDQCIKDATGVRAYLAEDIVSCVAKGAGLALEELDTVTDPTRIYHKKAYIHD